MTTDMILPSVTDNNGVTMTSREIAELTEKQHKHVLQDIRNLLKSLDCQTLGSGLVFEV